MQKEKLQQHFTAAYCRTHFVRSNCYKPCHQWFICSMQQTSRQVSNWYTLVTVFAMPHLSPLHFVSTQHNYLDIGNLHVYVYVWERFYAAPYTTGTFRHSMSAGIGWQAESSHAHIYSHTFIHRRAVYTKIDEGSVVIQRHAPMIKSISETWQLWILLMSFAIFTLPHTVTHIHIWKIDLQMLAHVATTTCPPTQADCL